VLIPALAGCTRTHYRLAADAQTYATLDEKSAFTPWAIPRGFNILPARGARFFDPTPRDDPLLPVPAPQLYSYQLGQLLPRDPSRFRQHAVAATPPLEEIPPGPPISFGPSTTGDHEGTVVQTSFLQGGTATQVPAELPPPATVSEYGELRVVPIPAAFWESLPRPCLVRMLESPSVGAEYDRTFGRPPPELLLDRSPRLALEDIVEIAQINNRAYQRQKEILYTVALRLTQERFAYQLKFSSSGNGTDVDFSHSRSAGVTDDTLSVPTQATVDKVLSTGGDLLARFANDVVLTYNGPNGFAADVGSSLLFDLSQSLLQRDIVFESLTQAERDVVYAARDYARFRKQLFRDLAAQYYRLLLAYRDIEISTQDYFSNVRGFTQAQAEYRADRLPRIQVDQFEQDALRGRSRLIAQCTSLDNDLDNLKFLIGLPPETPLNLDLTELEQLSLRDEAVVAGELVRRAQRNLVSELQEERPDQLVLVSGAAVLADRLLSWFRLQRDLGADRSGEEVALEATRKRLAVEGTRLEVDFNQRALEALLGQPEASAPLVYHRTMELADSLLSLAARQLEVVEEAALDDDASQDLRSRLEALLNRYNDLQNDLDDTTELEALPEMIERASGLREDADLLVDEIDRLAGRVEVGPEARLHATREVVERLLDYSRLSLAETSAGLTPIEMDMDDAMLTGLVQRFDLMNERGALADVWRRIKLAGDDLRSVLNLQATQLVRTHSDVNRPFDFTWDESNTRLALSFDAPLNRMAQRNAFRRSLIDYQVALRRVMELEDSIKLSLRNDLRQLQLDREQYRISVASAALAFERVVSTKLELSLGRQNVTARDVLESQAAYTASLRTVASDHVGYILDRIDLFLDLELLQVDESGFWPQVYDESFQPSPNLVPPFAGPPYGELPPRVWQSKAIRRMLWVPPGVPGILGDEHQPDVAEPLLIQSAVATDLPPDGAE
jgi:outer membrane protein TolC